MTDHELQQLRREKWRLNGAPVRTLDEARALPRVGRILPDVSHAASRCWRRLSSGRGRDRTSTCRRSSTLIADPRAQEATELMVRLLRDHDAYEANQFDENNAFLVAASIFPYFYALVGERNPKQPPQPDRVRNTLNWPAMPLS